MSTTLVAERAPQAEPRPVRPAAPSAMLPVLLQLCLVVVVVHEYQLETRAFFYVALLTVAGFAIHSLLPRAHRLAFFVMLSLAAIFVVFDVADALWLIAAGCALIGLCHVPVPFRVRVLLVLGLAAVLAGARADMLPSFASAAVWPVLGSMFMFRLALYLHALKHDPEKPTPARTLAYFFMLPNVVFPLFPVVDFTTFGRTYYDRDERRIYETGVQWIVRGIVQLVLYRVVYLFVVPDPADVTTIASVGRAMLAVFLLYLRVSGSFHLIIGMLHLFGFRLPETHHLYYLASSFTDFWRRINIYWKDFMMKLVYYPSFFRLRRWGMNRAIVASTVMVFVATWLLHSYQWFWLRGGFPITIQDTLFWGILGALVVVNTLREVRRGRNRSVGPAGWNLSRALRTVAMFATICVLWSLWSAASMIDWLWMLRAAGNIEAVHVVKIGVALTLAILVAGVPWDGVLRDRPNPFARHATVTRSALLLGLIVLAQPVALRSTVPALAPAMALLTTSSLNAQDTDREHDGYYENLDSPSRSSLQLWNVASRPPDTLTALWATGIINLRDDFMGHELHASREMTWNGHRFTTNRWGMRDRDYSLTKPNGTIRIALLGPSHAMGSNVSDHDVFETLVEERLNRELAPVTGLSYEILNFSVGAFGLPQAVAMMEDRAFDFDPDVVMLVVSSHNRGSAETNLMSAAQRGYTLPDSAMRRLFESQDLDVVSAPGLPVPFHPFRRIANRFGLSYRMPRREAELRVREIAAEAERLCLMHAAALVRAHGALPVLLVLDLVDPPRTDLSPLLEVAGQEGFTIFDLLDVYPTRDRAALRVADRDAHPNASGHALIAERLFRELTDSQILDRPNPPMIAATDEPG